MSGKWIAMFIGLYVIILILSCTSSSSSALVTSTGQPMSQLQYLLNISNAFQHLSILGGFPLPWPNASYFSALWQTLTLQPVQDMFNTGGFALFYYIVIVPIVAMACFALVSLATSIIRGNLVWS